jgi:hypothetical protein
MVENAGLPPNYDEQIVAANALIPAAAEMSKTLDTFASWATGGYAAALALFISNTDAHRWVGQEKFAACGQIFAAVLIMTAVQKYLSVVLNGISTSYAAGDKAVMQQIERRKEQYRFNMNVLVQLVDSTMWSLPKLIGHLLRKKNKTNDYMGSARIAMALMQTQAALVLAIVGLLVLVACYIVWR